MGLLLVVLVSVVLGHFVVLRQVYNDATAKKAKLDPTSDLLAGTTYKAVVNTGAKDLADNLLSAKKVWYLTTRR